MLAAIVATPFLPRADVVVATSPQFFTPCAACVVALLQRRPWVFELRDLWPDSIVAVGAMQDTPLIRALRRLEYFLYRRAARIVSVTQSFREVLSANGIAREKIAVVQNGADLEAYAPGPRSEALAARFGVEGKFVAAYVGTIGLAHGLGTLLDAAERLRGRADIAFVLVGAGAEEQALRAQAAARGLSNVHFAGSVSKAEVREVWRLCDAALVLLRDSPLFRHVLPSKLFEAMATARPNFMKVAPLWHALEREGAWCRARIVHTGQHYDANMSDAFFRDLQLPEPDVHLEVGSGSHAEQTGGVMIA